MAETAHKTHTDARENPVNTLSLTPLQPIAEDLEECPLRKLEQFHLKLRFPALNDIVFLERQSQLAIDREIRLFACNGKPNLDHRRILHDQWTVRESV